MKSVKYNKSNIKNQKRKSRIRKNILRLSIFFALFCAVVIVVLILGSNTVKTNASSDNYVKCYKSITIHAGDTLWSIADEYMEDSEYIDAREYIDEVKQINGLTSDNVTYGEHIIVPYYTAES